MSKRIILIFSIFIFLFNQILRLSANDDTYINSSNITYNESENIVELAENSKINYKNTNILIDKGIIDYNKKEFEVFGNFYLYEDLTILSGKNLVGSTTFNSFSAEDVSFIYNNDLKIDSDNLNKDGNLIYFYNNFLTPCELEGFFNCPTWSLRIDKTKYDIEKDKFTHFDTFLQIADYKIFYLPYFSHYGVKAPRERGFLTPSLEFTIGDGQGIITPYYIPFNQTTDILIKPKMFLTQDFEFLEKYHIETVLENKRTGGNTYVTIENIKNKDIQNINSTLKINTKQVINKNKIISASGLFTNSISTTRSKNKEPITFEDIYLRFENYNFLIKDDYLKTELSSVKTFESTLDKSIPISPSVSYLNSYNFDDSSLLNEFNFVILKRNESSEINPSDGFKLNFNSEVINNSQKDDLIIYNKLLFTNSLNSYRFNKNEKLNHDSFKSNISLSSEMYMNKMRFFLPRVKFIFPLQLNNSNKIINEDSESITFNYQNQYSENRFFGNDLIDTSKRIIYGLENTFKINNQKINFGINQSFEDSSTNSYANKTNQNSKFSDFAIEANSKFNDIFFKIDLRLDNENLSKKEMGYLINFSTPLNFTISYNETQSEAFKNYSNDTQLIDLNLSKKIDDNFIFSYSSNLDVRNNYDPYKSVFKISIFDDCSQLDLSYSNIRFNDDYNTQPEETIGITFSMDYLGFFGYEQTTNLFSSKP